MQIEYKTEKGIVLFIKIEKDYSVAGLNDGHIYFWTSSLLQSIGDYPLSIEIPKANFEYLGLTSEITEEQANMMVDNLWNGYRKYEFLDGNFGNYKRLVKSSSLDSFKSIMQHLEIKEGKWIVLFKQNES